MSRPHQPHAASEQRTIMLTTEPVELYKILKFEGLTDSGANAKAAISDGLVRVNGNIETRKRKKIVSGDVITFQGIKMLTVVNKAPPHQPSQDH